MLLVGDLGAGKTTFTQGLGAGLGVRGPVTSPTFVIARVHPCEVDGPALVHVDAYRLGGIEELDDLDLDASLDEAVTVVEWGEGIAEGLADSRLEVRIARASDAPTDESAPRPGGPASDRAGSAELVVTLVAHLTDLHFGEPPEARDRTDRVARPRAVPRPAPDLLLVTGDVADHGTRGGVRRGARRPVALARPAAVGPGQPRRPRRLRRGLLGARGADGPLDQVARRRRLSGS